MSRDKGGPDKPNPDEQRTPRTDPPVAGRCTCVPGSRLLNPACYVHGNGLG